MGDLPPGDRVCGLGASVVSAGKKSKAWECRSGNSGVRYFLVSGNE